MKQIWKTKLIESICPYGKLYCASCLSQMQFFKVLMTCATYFWCWNPLRKCRGKCWWQFFPDLFLDTLISPSASLFVFFTQIQELLTILCETWMVTPKWLFLLVTYNISQSCRKAELWKWMDFKKLPPFPTSLFFKVFVLSIEAVNFSG